LGPLNQEDFEKFLHLSKQITDYLSEGADNIIVRGDIDREEAIILEEDEAEVEDDMDQELDENYNEIE
jgi:hypothetical protein